MKVRFALVFLTAVDFILILKIILSGTNITVLNPQGLIAASERSVIIAEVAIMLLIIVPAVLLVFYMAYKYREGNNADYAPDEAKPISTQLLWWGVPALVVLILSFIVWNATHKLDPYKTISSSAKPLTIQVVALRWKWLFIYPSENIATVNFIEIPVGTPVNFELTADAPMNSFWIPQLSGQIYAMTGMSTSLHIEADKPGDYEGSAAEISGAGFAGMRFTTRARSQADYNAWISTVKNSSKPLDQSEYDNLSKPSEYNPQAFYSPVEKGLYNSIVAKFMSPQNNNGMIMEQHFSVHH